MMLPDPGKSYLWIAAAFASFICSAVMIYLVKLAAG